MITVYLTNAEHAEIENGISVRKELGLSEGEPELVCLDASDHEVGRFRYGEVAGYSISGIADINKAIVSRLIDEVVNKKRIHELPEFFAADFLEHVPSTEMDQDIDAVRQLYSTLHTAFPDAQFTVKTMIGEGGLVAVHSMATTHHLGELYGASPSGRQVTIANIDIYRLSAGKIVEHWGYGNDLGLAQQLGLCPPLTPELAENSTGGGLDANAR